MAFLCGLIPNLMVLGLNMGYNRTSFPEFDPTDLSQVQLIGNGILFPVLIDFAKPGSLSFWTYLNFFTAQLSHGAVAASLAALALSYVDTRYVLPRLFLCESAQDIRPQLSRFGQWVDRYSTLLKLAPLLAVMRLTLVDHGHRASVFVLSLFGLACVGFALAIAPRIRKTLHIVVTPTEELLAGGAPTSS